MAGSLDAGGCSPVYGRRICKENLPVWRRIPLLYRATSNPLARTRDRMSKKSLFKALTETGPLIALGTA
ncbi:hypothetical protein, partial [Bradyrhizobium guangdongense]|uniref:hypothetical protein n=1 Tax=Bradyrhizobium guangdongense TaxID=1325090 RepID=UPI001AEC792E